MPNHHAMVLAYLIPTIYDAALGVFGFTLPLFLLGAGVDPLVMGSLLALPAMVQIVVRIPSGLLAGKIGNVRGMLLGCALTALAGALIAGSGPARLVAVVAAAQMISGLGRANFWPANQAHLFEIAGDRIGSVIGTYNFVLTLGSMAGPLMAGALIGTVGTKAPFALLSGLCVVAAALLVFRRAPGAGRAGSEAAAPGQVESQYNAWSSLGIVMRSPGVWLASVLCIASVVPYTVIASFYPVLLTDRGLAAGSIGLLVTVRSGAVALFSLLTGQYVQRRRRPAIILAGGIVGAAGLALIPLVSATPLSVLPMLLLGFCGGAMHNVQMAVSGDAVGRRERALALAVVGSVGNLAMALAPLGYGWMTARGALESAFTLTALVIAATSAIAWQWSLRTLRTSEPVPLRPGQISPDAPSRAAE